MLSPERDLLRSDQTANAAHPSPASPHQSLLMCFVFTALWILQAADNGDKESVVCHKTHITASEPNFTAHTVMTIQYVCQLSLIKTNCLTRQLNVIV